MRASAPGGLVAAAALTFLALADRGGTSSGPHAGAADAAREPPTGLVVVTLPTPR